MDKGNIEDLTKLRYKCLRKQFEVTISIKDDIERYETLRHIYWGLRLYMLDIGNVSTSQDKKRLSQTWRDSEALMRERIQQVLANIRGHEVFNWVIWGAIAATAGAILTAIMLIIA